MKWKIGLQFAFGEQHFAGSKAPNGRALGERIHFRGFERGNS
jgi:hypothetical protein